MPLVCCPTINLVSRDHFAWPISQAESLGHPQQHFGMPSERDSRQTTLFQMCKKPTSLVWQRFCGMPRKRMRLHKQLLKHSQTSRKLEKTIRLCSLIMWRPYQPQSPIHREENMIDHITGNTTFNKIIEIIVSPTGETRLETKGFTGEECREASRFVERALGAAAGEQITAEFHSSQVVSQAETRSGN
jgi:hypothetical protein